MGVSFVLMKRVFKIIIRPNMLGDKKNELEKKSIKQIIRENAEVFKKLE